MRALDEHAWRGSTDGGSLQGGDRRREPVQDCAPTGILSWANAGGALELDKKRTTGITKAGSTRLRWLLVQAAWSLMRCRPNDPMAVWAREVAHRRGKQVAIVALARKMAGVLFAMWRDEIDYDPSIMVMGPTRRPPNAKAEKAPNKKA